MPRGEASKALSAGAQRKRRLMGSLGRGAIRGCAIRSEDGRSAARRRAAHGGDKQGEGALLRAGSYQFLHAAGFVASLDESSPARRAIHDGRAGDEARRKQSPGQNLGMGWVSRGGRPWLGGASGGADDCAPSLVSGRDVKRVRRVV